MAKKTTKKTAPVEKVETKEIVNEAPQVVNEEIVIETPQVTEEDIVIETITTDTETIEPVQTPDKDKWEELESYKVSDEVYDISGVKDEKELAKVYNALVSDMDAVVTVVKQFDDAQKDFAEKIEANPENAENIIKEEIKKAEEIKKVAEKLANKPIDNEGFTSFWNGMSFDF